MSADDDSSSDDDRFQRSERVFKDRINFQHDGDKEQRERFRGNEDVVAFLLGRIGSQLEHRTRRNYALSPRQQLLLCLRFLSGNGFYHLTGDSHGIHKSTVCRVIKRVVITINRTLYDELVRFPEDMDSVRQQFFDIAGMPSVCGLVDGSLIEIKAPNENECQFIDRHGNHSVNAIFVCGPRMKFFFCSARYPGSVHDSRAFRNSSLFTLFDANWRPFPSAIILGDSAYPTKEWLIPPLPVAVTEAEQRFNASHKTTRSTIERAFGLLKQRFNVLKTPIRVQTPEYACEIIKCCAALHNLCLLFNGVPEYVAPEDVSAAEPLQSNEIENTARRQQLISYFANHE